jgi:hypothetical protein
MAVVIVVLEHNEIADAMAAIVATCRLRIAVAECVDLSADFSPAVAWTRNPIYGSRLSIYTRHSSLRFFAARPYSPAGPAAISKESEKLNHVCLSFPPPLFWWCCSIRSPGLECLKRLWRDAPSRSSATNPTDVDRPEFAVANPRQYNVFANAVAFG